MVYAQIFLYHAKKRENERFVYKFACVKIYSVSSRDEQGTKVADCDRRNEKCHFCLRSHKIKKGGGRKFNLAPAVFWEFGGGDSF